MSPYGITISAFVLGLLFGSFLNVCITRLPAHQSVICPRSCCPNCGHAIRWYDNIPVLSWLLLRARCRDCKASISSRYPLIELATGLWFATVAAQMPSELTGFFGSAPSFIFYPGLTLAVTGKIVLGFLLIGLMVMDWQTLRLPDAFTLTGIVIGFLLTCVQAAMLPSGVGDVALNTTHQLRLSSPGSQNALGNVFMTGTEAMVLGRVLAIVGAALVLLLFRWGYKAVRGQDGLGLGDVKLLAMIAAFLGFFPAMVALFAGVVCAAVYGIVLMAQRRAGRESRLPLGSFLCGGGLISAVYGARIVAWYASVMR